MLAMYTRILKTPDHSFFLFGPRGTGKTTWLKTVFKGAKWFDLLRSDQLLKLLRKPEQLRFEVESLGEGAWIVIDEIQKLPQLLNEIHSLIADHGNRYQFALSGSSARKLKRLDANLLAGRVFNRKFFPLTGKELSYNFATDDLLQYGTLPKVCAEPKHRVDILDAYHPEYRRRGIATRCMRGVLAHLQRSQYVSVTLVDWSGFEGFYQQFGFRVSKDVVQVWERGKDPSGK